MGQTWRQMIDRIGHFVGSVSCLTKPYGAGAEGVRAASLYDDSLSDRRFWYAAESIFSTIFENERNRFTEIRSGLFRCSALTVSSGNLRRVGDEPLFIPFDE
jgi:hypothetical protein